VVSAASHDLFTAAQVEPLGASGLDGYLGPVARDRPDSLLP